MSEDVEMQEEERPAATTTREEANGNVKKEREFMLSAVVQAHKSDIRAMVAVSAGQFLTGSRDDPIKLWGKRAGEFDVRTQFSQDKGANVIAIALYEFEDAWFLFAGRRDGTIYVYTRDSINEPAFQLTKHTASISCLHVDTQNKVLLSGSWDNDAIVWPLGENKNMQNEAIRLMGHTLSVWTVTSVPGKSNGFLTGSADKLIKLWEGEKCIRTYKGHSDVVRALVPFSPERFFSAANDSSIRLWSFDNDAPLAKFNSKSDHYIFTMSLQDNYAVTSGEGGLIEVWRVGMGVREKSLYASQQIIVPCSTIWHVAFIDDDEFIAAASDGHIYIYTRNEKRLASEDVLLAYNEAVSEQQKRHMEHTQKEAANSVVRIKVSLDDGPPSHVLEYEKGTDPIITAEKFIQDYQLPVSYLDEIVEYICMNIPEARAARAAKTIRRAQQPGQKVKIGNTEYDYAFKVTIAEDGRQLVVAYNATDDPNLIAQRFVEQHNLPIGYFSKVAGMIQSQTQQSDSQNYADPFTGGGRHVPPAGMDTGTLGSYSDPFTGGGRYVPGLTQASSASNSFGDPYTSSGKYEPGSAASSQLVPNASYPIDKRKPRSDLVPMKQFFEFGVEILSQKAIAKLRELNEKQNAFKLNPEQMDALERLMDPHSASSLSVTQLVSALDLGLQWSLEDVVPIFDLFRIALLHAQLNEHYCNVKTRGIDTLDRLTALLVSEPADPLRILICRVITNACAHEWGREMLTAKITEIVPLAATQFKSPKHAIQLASASALANWSLLLLQKSESVQQLGPREDVLRAIIAATEGINSFSDYSMAGLERLLQAIVTLMWGDSSVIRLAKQRNVVAIVSRMKDAAEDESTKAITRDIVEMTHAI